MMRQTLLILLVAGVTLAVHEGFLPEKPYKDAALQATAALRDYVSEDGVVLSACPGPGPVDSVESYLGTTFRPGDHHGAGALIYAFAGEILLRRGASRQRDDEARSPAGWMTLFEADRLDRQPVDPKFERLLRGASIAMWVDVRCCGGGALPFHLGLTRSTRFGGGRARFQCGEEAPDFALLRMKAALEGPGYSDLNPYDPTDVLTSKILREFLLLMQGYEVQEDASEGRFSSRDPVLFPREGRTTT